MRYFLFLVLISCPLLTEAQQEAKRIDSFLRSQYRSTDPGIAIAVEKKGRLIFEKEYGLADLKERRPIGTETRFNIGSVTKQFTALAILQLIEKGKIELDEKLIRIFPGFNPKTGNEITVRELLTHSSGIVDHYDHVDTQKVKHATIHDVYLAVNGIDSTYFKPGSRFQYSNTGYCMLGMIIEKISGISYGEYIKRNIFNPLGMDHSSVFEYGIPISEPAIGYDTVSGNFKRDDADDGLFFSTEADGGIYTTIPDYLKWYKALKGERLLKKKLVIQARSEQFLADSSKGLYYGWGWFIRQVSNGNEEVFHEGSNGGFSANIYSLPEQDYILAIFSNRSDKDLGIISRKINNMIGYAGK